MMMINFTLLLLFNLIFIFSSGKCVSSCIYKAVGERVKIPLDIGELPEENHLTWTHIIRKLYSRRGSDVRIRVYDVDRTGSLILENIQKNYSGEYKGEVHDTNGKFINKITHQLCVQEPVPEPTVTVECVEKGVNLSCNPVNSNEVSVSWMRNGETFNTTRAVLHVSWSELKPEDLFSCKLTNMISSKSAKRVHPVCSAGASEDNERKKEEDNNNNNQNDAVSETKLLFGLDFWWMLVILTAGVSLLLILFIICLVCVCRCSARNKRKAKEEAEFRLTSLMPDYTDQPDVQYMQKTGSHRPSKSMRPLPPLPSPRGLQPQ